MNEQVKSLAVCLLIMAAFGTSVTANDSAGITDPAVRALEQIETLAADENGMMEVYYDYVEDGELKGGKLLVPLPKPELAALTAMPPYNAYPLIDNGPSENRIDIVCVGDGYTADEMDVYLGHVQNVITSFFLEEPLDIYADYFNVHVVEVISNESGVDEPDYEIYRDTALDMTFNCFGTPRLLCVDYSKAWTAAENARDVDLVLALANTTRYGGAGYSKLSTLAGGNSSAIEIALHEFGHSFAGLADEYHYGDGSTYTGSELIKPNVSIYDADEQLAQQLKWYLWLDLPEVDTFEGAFYYEYGIYRPTQNSKMKALGYPFRPVNVEQFIFSIYEEVSSIDAVEPVSQEVLPAATVFSVTSQTPATYALDMQWQIDGVPVPDANETIFCPQNYLAANTVQTLTVQAADNTLLVRDEDKKQDLLIDRKNWLVWKSIADFDDNGVVNTEDLRSTVLWWLSDNTDFDIAPPGGDGIVNFLDFSVLAAQWSQ